MSKLLGKITLLSLVSSSGAVLLASQTNLGTELNPEASSQYGSINKRFAFGKDNNKEQTSILSVQDSNKNVISVGYSQGDPVHATLFFNSVAFSRISDIVLDSGGSATAAAVLNTNNCKLQLLDDKYVVLVYQNVQTSDPYSILVLKYQPSEPLASIFISAEQIQLGATTPLEIDNINKISAAMGTADNQIIFVGANDKLTFFNYIRGDNVATAIASTYSELNMDLKSTERLDYNSLHKSADIYVDTSKNTLIFHLTKTDEPANAKADLVNEYSNSLTVSNLQVDSNKNLLFVLKVGSDYSLARINKSTSTTSWENSINVIKNMDFTNFAQFVPSFVVDSFGDVYFAGSINKAPSATNKNDTLYEWINMPASAELNDSNVNRIITHLPSTDKTNSISDLNWAGKEFSIIVDYQDSNNQNVINMYQIYTPDDVSPVDGVVVAAILGSLAGIIVIGLAAYYGKKYYIKKKNPLNPAEIVRSNDKVVESKSPSPITSEVKSPEKKVVKKVSKTSKPTTKK